MFVVINHLHLDCPVSDLLPTLESEFPPVFRTLPGFEGCRLVQEADDRLAVLIFWKDGPSAQNGAATIGPTLFAKHIAPRLASEQQRTVGPVVLEVSAQA